MCGIAGYIGTKRITEDHLQATLATMRRRGPDHAAYKTLNTGDVNVCLLHSRLSIIDLDARSNQPFTIGNFTIVFNGEIYNYVELKTQLIGQGIQFSTSSDTEVLLWYYIKYGKECVKYFEGMWSFAIYDAVKKTLFVSRDRFAEKPLYYFKSEHGFYFASETNTLRKFSERAFDINYDHLKRYMVNGHKSLYKTNESFYHGISEVNFATNLTISSDLRITAEQYWKPEYKAQKMSSQEAIEGIRERLVESLKIRLRSDVPLAFCLSGGVDSASLVSIAAKLFNADVNTFSIIDTDARYDENDHNNP